MRRWPRSTKWDGRRRSATSSTWVGCLMRIPKTCRSAAKSTGRSKLCLASLEFIGKYLFPFFLRRAQFSASGNGAQHLGEVRILQQVVIGADARGVPVAQDAF